MISACLSMEQTGKIHPLTALLLMASMGLYRHVTSACPTMCICDGDSWRCSGRLEHFCDELGRNASLMNLVTSLDFSDSGLTSVRCFDILTLPRLSRLDLSNNNISDDAFTVGTFPRVRELNLHGNRFKSFLWQTLDGLAQLVTLDLSLNEIEAVEPRRSRASYIRHLNLSDNALETLPRSFSQLRSLSTLDLSGNRLHSLSPGFVSNSSGLSLLVLSRNRLERLPHSLLTQLHRIHTLDLSHNPWDCSCSNAALIAAPRDTINLINANDTECGSPPELTGTTLHELFTANRSNCIKLHNRHKTLTVMTSALLIIPCDAPDVADPIVVWTTPWGDRFSTIKNPANVDKNSRDYVTSLRDYSGYNPFLSSSIGVDRNGSLLIIGARGFYSGDFSCLIENEVIRVNYTVSLSVHAYLADTVLFSIILGLVTYFGCATIAILVAVIQVIRDRTCQRKVITKDVMIIDDEVAGVPLDRNQNMPILMASPRVPPRYTVFTPTILSLDGSPGLLCKTPEEGYYDDDDLYDREDYDRFVAGGSGRILETLDEVRDRLRQGVERRIGRVRERVHTIKVTGNQYMRTIRDSSSTAVLRVRASVESIRESSSQAVGRVRVGVAMSMGTVKSRVRSIREFCGTGEMGTHTVSTISVTTDIDTDERKEVMKSFTYV